MGDSWGARTFATVCHWAAVLRLGLLVRLVYVVFLLVVTLPVVFYALAAYQYQVDATTIAEQRDLDAAQLMARAAAWNSALYDLTALVKAGADDDDTANANPSQPNGAGDLADDPDDEAASTAETDAGTSAQARNQQILAAYRKAVAALATEGPDGIAPPAPEAKGERTARILASELQRFDRLGLPLGPSWYSRPSVLAELPGWTLTLVVTLAAGLLGSLIFVLKAMLRQLLDAWSIRTKTPCRSRPWSWLLLRPVFGVVIAFGAYVALQSGLLVIDGAMALTPSAYVTAAVGLIAGLLSWQVIDTIEGVGERWLASQRPVWGYGLESQIDAKGKTQKELATLLGVSPGVMAEWVAVRVPVPKDQSQRLAAELNLCPEQLFQPVPPWRRSANTAKPETAGDKGQEAG